MFMCQRDSFLKEYESEITTCDLVVDAATVFKHLGINGDEVKDKNVYQIVLNDTILFPEGGGQPDDRGFINDAEVVRVIRNGTEAIHYVVLNSNIHAAEGDARLDGSRCSFKSGDKVSTKINWQRRFDHMQQHSGQHLITAVTDQTFGYPTTSWWLGTEESYIELGSFFVKTNDDADVTDEELQIIEETVNSKIRGCAPVTVDVVELDDPKLQNARGRNLPEDVKGQIRIVTMDGIESNVCCGTHVTNLSQLQVIKLLNVVKKKGKCLLYFLCGNRVIDRFSQQFKREQKLMGILKSSPAEFPSAAEKLNLALKSVRKTCQGLCKDLATLEAKKITENGNKVEKFWSYHRENVDLDFGNALLREIGQVKSSVLLITLKTEGNSGHMMLVGGDGIIDKELMIQLGDNLCEILDGKGSLRGNLYQAKVNKVNAVNKAVKAAQEFVNKLNITSDPNQ